jgi:hypothetical protein
MRSAGTLVLALWVFISVCGVACAETVEGTLRSVVRPLPGSVDIGDYFKLAPDAVIEGFAKEVDTKQHVCISYNDLSLGNVADRVKIVSTDSGMLAVNACDCAARGPGCYEGDILTISKRDGGATTMLTIGTRFAVDESTVLDGYPTIQDVKILDQVRIDYSLRDGKFYASKLTLLKRSY